MASTLSATVAQGSVLFEDLAVYFSQEECVTLYPAEPLLSGDATKEYCEPVTSLGEEGETEINQQLSLESVELEELALEKYSIAVPLIYSPEKSSEDEVGSPEGKTVGGTSTCKKRFISLLVTIENHTPLVELSQCLGVRRLSEILEFPWEETKDVHKPPEGDQKSFSDDSYLVLQPKIHSKEKKFRCGDCGKIFNHRANLRTHRRIHTGEKPYKCAECGTSFRQHLHLSRHRNVHLKEKLHTCGICGKSFMWLTGLKQHQRTHTTEEACDMYFSQKTNLASLEDTHALATHYQCNESVKSFGQCPHLTLPREGEEVEEEEAEQYRDDGGNVVVPEI